MGRQALVLTGVQSSLFFYGTLCHLPLLRMVLGNLGHLTISDAVLPGHAVHWVAGQNFPVILETPNRLAHGLLAEGLTSDDVARLNFYEGGYDYALKPVEVQIKDDVRRTEVYFTGKDRWPVGAPWDLADWERDWSEVMLIAGAEIMQDFGLRDPQDAIRRYPQFLQRAASRVRAVKLPVPQVIGAGPGRETIEVIAQRQPYSEYFALQEMDLTFPHFDGSKSVPVTRAAFVSGDAVTVLPYDPGRDRVLVVEQFRFGPYLRGDPHPWSLEPVAGRIDAGESPDAAARRETLEETGVAINGLLPVSRYYPSPGAMTEYLFSYVGLADLSDDVAGIGGLAAEAEDIKSHILSFNALMDLVGSGEADNGPLILTALWLARHRDVIRQGA